jgi:hypothetical protein
MLVTLLEIYTSVNEAQPSNILLLIVFTVVGQLNVLKPVCRKHCSPIVFTVAGILILVNKVQLRKTWVPIVTKEVAKLQSTAVKTGFTVMVEKAVFPMEVTVAGITATVESVPL